MPGENGKAQTISYKGFPPIQYAGVEWQSTDHQLQRFAPPPSIHTEWGRENLVYNRRRL